MVKGCATGALGDKRVDYTTQAKGSNDSTALSSVHCTQGHSEDRLHPVSTGIGNMKNELYLSMHTYDVLELRLTR